MTSTTPGQPAPIRVNHARLFALGTAMWVIALIVLIVLQTMKIADCSRWIWVCLTGAILGAYGVFYARHSWRAK